jgi:hypothetical protein
MVAEIVGCLRVGQLEVEMKFRGFTCGLSLAPVPPPRNGKREMELEISR